jgi:predicted Zn finger-like uncharacterized protein
MDITCDKCQSKFKIADEKIPKGKTVTLRCPKCETRISVSSPLPDAAAQTDIIGNVDNSTDESMESAFDFTEEEGKTALVCENNPQIREKIINNLKLMEYNVVEAINARDALTKMRFHIFNLVVVNEAFDMSNIDNNSILIYLARLNMVIRRNIFVVLLSNQYRTMDKMMAFNKSVNLIINLENIDDADRTLSRSIAENEIFYRVFKEALKKSGRV